MSTADARPAATALPSAESPAANSPRQKRLWSDCKALLGRRAHQDAEMSPDELRTFAAELRRIAAEFDRGLADRSAAELRAQAAMLRAAASHDTCASQHSKALARTMLTAYIRSDLLAHCANSQLHPAMRTGARHYWPAGPSLKPLRPIWRERARSNISSIPSSWSGSMVQLR